MHGLYSRNHHVPAAWYTPFEMLRDAGYQIPRMQGFQADVNYNQLGFTTGVNPVPGPEIVAKKDRGPKDILQPLIWLENHGEKPFFSGTTFSILTFPTTPRHGSKINSSRTK